MESLLPLLINAAIGGGGGFLGNMLKKNGLGLVGNLLAGAVGGGGLPAILGAVAPTLLAGADGGPNMITTVLTSLIGGGAGSLIGGLFKKA